MKTEYWLSGPERSLVYNYLMGSQFMKMNEDIKKLECDNCGKVSIDVEECNDPYDEDVNNEKNECQLCPECYQRMSDAI